EATSGESGEPRIDAVIADVERAEQLRLQLGGRIRRGLRACLTERGKARRARARRDWLREVAYQRANTLKFLSVHLDVTLREWPRRAGIRRLGRFVRGGSGVLAEAWGGRGAP